MHFCRSSSFRGLILAHVLVFTLPLSLIAQTIPLPGLVSAWGRNIDAETQVPAGLVGVTAISAGAYHSLALKDDGTVVGWGRNTSGQADIPADLTGVAAIDVGSTHNLALKDDGTVFAWGGLNQSDQTLVPAGLITVTAIAAGSDHSLALREDGTVVGWGSNSNGQRVVPAGLNSVSAIAAGGYHSLALKIDGTVVAWGSNNHGQAEVPVDLSNVIAISAGDDHSLALKADGSVVAWGSNSYGQSDTPIGLTNVTAIAAGGNQSLALKSDGTVVGWGRSLADVPEGLAGVTAISAGWLHSLALVPEGLLRLSPPFTEIPASSGEFLFQVRTTSSNLAWNVTRTANWITLQTTNGIGFDAVLYRVSPNSSSHPRKAVIQIHSSIGTRIFEITQAGVVSSYVVSVSEDIFSASGGSGVLTVSSSVADAEWTIDKPEWIDMTGSFFTGTRTRGFTVQVNTTPGLRTGVIKAAGHSITISQTGNGGVFYDELAASPQLGGGWIKSDWLGAAYIVKFPWIFLEPLGWIRIYATTADEFWFYRPEGSFGFAYTGKNMYPNIYYTEEQRWLWYAQGIDPIPFLD